MNVSLPKPQKLQRIRAAVLVTATVTATAAAVSAPCVVTLSRSGKASRSKQRNQNGTGRSRLAGWGLTMPLLCWLARHLSGFQKQSQAVSKGRFKPTRLRTANQPRDCRRTTLNGFRWRQTAIVVLTFTTKRRRKPVGHRQQTTLLTWLQ